MNLISSSQVDTGEEDVFCLCASETNLLSGHHQLIKSWSPEKNVEAAWRLSLPVSGDVTCICTSPANHELFAVSVDTSVLLYNQHSPSSPLHHFTCNQEEINEICIDRRGSTYLHVMTLEQFKSWISRLESCIEAAEGMTTSAPQSCTTQGSHGS